MEAGARGVAERRKARGGSEWEEGEHRYDTIRYDIRSDPIQVIRKTESTQPFFCSRCCARTRACVCSRASVHGSINQRLLPGQLGLIEEELESSVPGVALLLAARLEVEVPVARRRDGQA